MPFQLPSLECLFQFLRFRRVAAEDELLADQFGNGLSVGEKDEQPALIANTPAEANGNPKVDELNVAAFPLFFRRFLYVVEFGLKNKPPRLAVFTRTYVQDCDLINSCTNGKRALIVPAAGSAEIFDQWEAENKLREMDGRASNLSRSSSSSSEEKETAEQAMMRAMGLPGSFGETKQKKNKQQHMKEKINEFFRLTNNLGFVGGVHDGGSSPTFTPGQINKFTYKYKSKRSSKVPQYHFVYPPNAGGDAPKTPPLSAAEVEDEETRGLERTSSSDSDVLSGGEEEKTEEIVEVGDANRLDFDFAFDPERDRDLIAVNAKTSSVWSKQLNKYWHQRYRLFSKLDEGVLMDREGWFSVTPERVAEHIARRMVKREGAIILDAFTGVGGNAIQFAKQGAYVYAIDLDPVKIRCARRNAEIYGVLERITFICGDFFHVAASFLGSRPEADGSQSLEDAPFGIDGIFCSPPWGGPAYEQQEFDIESSMGGLNGIEIFRLAERISPNVAYFLPRNTSSAQIIGLANKHHKVEIEQSFLNGKNKAITAYFGALVD
ncbi:Trimethylguanosine synthase [Aphelenchoides fujianensis]|nr:Trimethylguanosine synthase [Aphelenchoides fujianensis]